MKKSPQVYPNSGGFFMEKNRAGRNRRRLIWIGMLALAGILVIAAVIWSGFLEDAAQENLATKTGQQTTEEVPENPLQIILSMGAEPGSLSISWKGDACMGRRLCRLDGDHRRSKAAISPGPVPASEIFAAKSKITTK